MGRVDGGIKEIELILVLMISVEKNLKLEPIRIMCMSHEDIQQDKGSMTARREAEKLEGDEMQRVIDETMGFVRNKLKGESSGHDWWHIYRVWKTAIQIAQEEQVDMFVVQLAALLHDIADWKMHDGDIMAGPRIAREFLERCMLIQRLLIM